MYSGIDHQGSAIKRREQENGAGMGGWNGEWREVGSVVERGSSWSVIVDRKEACVHCDNE